MVRTRAVAVAALFVLAMAAGCASADTSVSLSPSGVGGGDAASSGARATLLKAARTQQEATSGRFEMTATLEGGKAVGAKVTGAFDRAAGSAEAHSSVTGLGTGGAMDNAVVKVGSITYFQLGGMADLVGVDTPWISIDLSTWKGKVPDTNGAAGEPDSLVDALNGVSGGVTTVGTETVRGVTATHYKATVIPRKALDKVPADHRPKITGRYAGQLDTPIPVDVWIDAQGTLRKLVASSAVVTGGKLSTTLELFDVNQPVSISAPPADQVTPAKDIPGLGALFGN